MTHVLGKFPNDVQSLWAILSKILEHVLERTKVRSWKVESEVKRCESLRGGIEWSDKKCRVV